MTSDSNHGNVGLCQPSDDCQKLVVYLFSPASNLRVPNINLLPSFPSTNPQAVQRRLYMRVVDGVHPHSQKGSTLNLHCHDVLFLQVPVPDDGVARDIKDLSKTSFVTTLSIEWCQNAPNHTKFMSTDVAPERIHADKYTISVEDPQYGLLRNSLSPFQVHIDMMLLYVLRCLCWMSFVIRHPPPTHQPITMKRHARCSEILACY